MNAEDATAVFEIFTLVERYFGPLDIDVIGRFRCDLLIGGACAGEACLFYYNRVVETR